MEIQRLEHLEFPQLHQNQLFDTALKLKITSNNSDFGYIMDCGTPGWLLPETLECEGCTICCNSETNCQLKDSTLLSRQSLFLIALLTPQEYVPQVVYG